MDDDEEFQLAKRLPDIDPLSPDAMESLIAIIRISVPPLSMSRLVPKANNADQVRNTILNLIRKDIVRVLEIDDPRTIICLSLDPKSEAAKGGDYDPDEPKWQPLVLVDDLPGLPPPYTNV